MKKIFQAFLPTLFLSAALTASPLELETNTEQTLVIGIRPWDQNVQDPVFNEVLSKAHFLDFMADDGPTPLPQNFHHVDLNNDGYFSKESEDYKGPYSTPMSQFALQHQGHFQTILFDMATYQHARRDGAWADLKSMLKNGGKLIFPVFRATLSGVDLSQETAKAVCQEKIAPLFETTRIVTKENLPDVLGISLFTKPEKRHISGSENDGVIHEGCSHASIYDSYNAVPHFIIGTKNEKETFDEFILPSQEVMRDAIQKGKNFFVNEGTGFCVTSILGSFRGFSGNPEFVLGNPKVNISEISLEKGLHSLSIIQPVEIEGETIHLLIKSDKQFTNFIDPKESFVGFSSGFGMGFISEDCQKILIEKRKKSEVPL